MKEATPWRKLFICMHVCRLFSNLKITLIKLLFTDNWFDVISDHNPWIT